MPLSPRLNADDLCAVVRQDLNGPKYLGMFGLSEVPTMLKIQKLEDDGGEVKIWLGAGLADAVNFTKSAHLMLRSPTGADLAECECIPDGTAKRTGRAKQNRARPALVALAVLAAAAAAGSALTDWPRITVPPVVPLTKQPPWSRHKAEDEAERMLAAGTPDEILVLGRSLYDMGAGDLAAALFRTSGERGRPEGWLELARLYDPLVEMRSPHLTKDAKIAHFNYLRAARAGVGQAEAEAARLLAWLRGRAASGDASAIKTLQDIER